MNHFARSKRCTHKHNMITNPIIPGYYPDPSICRVGRDFYLVCSSFEMCPGLPVFHSTDLAHWQQIANAMTKENGLFVTKNGGVGGLMAPTIRYHEQRKLFYIINANFSDAGNYIITSRDPRGPWSAPHWLTDVPGIDASLFFDDDGKAYITGTGDVWDNGSGKKERGIWAAEFDMDTFRLKGAPTAIFGSALRNAASPEAPHLYHVGDYYYLIIAEGGTEHYHSVVAARCKAVLGAYEGAAANPVLTHRHMGYRCPITNVGHADMVKLPDGSWYAVLLASRLIEGKYKNLGRETFICPVEWEREWPLFSPKTGKLELEYEAPASLPVTEYEALPAKDDFLQGTLSLDWAVWGTPTEEFYTIADSRLSLRCLAQPVAADLEPMRMGRNTAKPPFAAVITKRQTKINTTASCCMEFEPQNAEAAGLIVVQAMNHQLHVRLVQQGGEKLLQAVVYTADYNHPPYFPGFEASTREEIIAQAKWGKHRIVIEIEMQMENYSIRYGTEGSIRKKLCDFDAAVLNPENVGCMAGTLIGVFATSNGKKSENHADFDWFSLK